MMHLHMVGIALGCAIAIRLINHQTLVQASQHGISLRSRWHRAIIAFVVPPLLLIATAIAIISMGTATGYHPWEGKLSYGISAAFIASSLVIWGHLSWAAIKTRLEVSRIPYQTIEAGSMLSTDSRTTQNAAKKGKVQGRVLNTPTLFSAQVGLWSSELVISQGLIDHLDDTHLAAVLAHESGHAHYRDTFWFFWLGGLRRVTAWLPHSEDLWQELLLLREVRADRWAAQSVDTLVLAESLMSVITAPLVPSEAICPGFSCAAPHSRLAQRIDALLESPAAEGFGLTGFQWGAIALSLMPLLTIPFHY